MMQMRDKKSEIMEMFVGDIARVRFLYVCHFLYVLLPY